jgi:hypothetical protein
MTLGGEYDSPQKQAIRERLWDAAISDLIEGHGKKGGELRILDLPGARCIYLHHLIERFDFVKENMIGVERLKPAFLSVHHFLAGRGVAFHSEIEDICESRELAAYFPVDIANLDFCGQGFIFPDLGKRTRENLEYQRRWDCVKAVLDFNKEKGKDVWYLLLTLACDRNNPAGKSYLLGQLDELRKLTGIPKDASGWKDNRLIQEVVPKIIADEALNRDYIPSAEAFESYRYVQQDHKYRMVAWKFKLVLDRRRSLGHNVMKQTECLEEFCRAYFAANAEELEL